jgi:hypothetical protein
MKTETGAPPPIVLDLVERFDRNREAYRSPDYNETQVRREFIDPLFAALGWDVWNEGGLAQAYKDVIHEDAIKVGGVTKAPDYCFRIGGTRKFFLEAKKPAVGIRDDPEPAYQLRRYAWSARLPLSILTDFEELAVYDCRFRPNRGDPASKARTVYMTCGEYPDRWDELASIFSKDAVLKGSFDKYAESTRRKRGTAPVDAEFLREIEQWRDELARNFALRNPELSVRDLNFAVQRTIDRIVFLRMCEDRGIERYGQLQTLLNGEQTYARLAVFFRQADDRYNSSLFYFRAEKHREPPDELTLSLRLDDRVLKDILGRLYYPESPYEFSVLPTEILGQVYEQFLGKVIRLTAGHRAVVEEKPEVRKAGGVYYTPTYIVDYIVQHTVGKLVEGKTPQQVGGLTENYQPSKAKGVHPLAVLDPACGSGSFLLGAYQFLLDWYRDRYLEDGPRGHATARRPRLFQHSSGEWRLTTGERKRILLAHIHGVDIDSQAVETTKLSLLLKVLEGETAETVGSNLRLFQERALPDLDRNIKCGNSLIGPDFYDGRQLDMFDDEQRYRINAFDWSAEFPDIFPNRAPTRAPSRRSDAAARPGDDSPGSAHASDSGFDAVIGNPPWGQKGIEKDDTILTYLRAKYASLHGIFDLFRPFVDQAIRLLRGDGWWGFVLPDIILLKDYQETRRVILEQLAVDRIDWWGMAFTEAVIDAATITGWKTSASPTHTVAATVHEGNGAATNVVRQSDFWKNDRLTFNLFLNEDRRLILAALSACPRLGDYFGIHEGVHSGNIRADLFVTRRVDRTCRELLFGRDEIRPYVLTWKGRFVRLGAMPATRSRARYANAGQPQWYDREKVLVRRTGDYVLAAVDLNRRYASNNFFIVFPSTHCALDCHGLSALLNSALSTWYFRAIEPRVGRVFAELKIKHLRTFPLPEAILRKSGCDRLNDLGKARLAVAEQASRALTPHARAAARRTCDILDTQIDALVMDAFELTQPQRTLILKEAARASETESAA